MDTDLLNTMLECIALGCDITNSLQKDVQERHGTVSNETVLLLNKYRIEYTKLNEILDILNEIN